MPLDSDSGISVPAHIFKTYDIRGVAYEDLTRDSMHLIGQAFGSECEDAIEGEVFIGCDARLSSPELKSALIDGLLITGRDIVDIGTVPTPLLYFAAHHSPGGTGLMVTASHNPPQYNGVKMVLAGQPFHGAAIQKLNQHIVEGRLTEKPSGKCRDQSIAEAYRTAVSKDIHIERPITAVLDCANGVAGGTAPQALRDAGCEVIELYCEVDGRFPNHSADPTRPENLQDLIAAVLESQADVGLAIDGDGDRLVAVSPQGEIIWPDRLMTLFVRSILPGFPERQVVFDIKCERALKREIIRAGGVPRLWKTGHSLIRAKMIECNGIFGGEMSGHLYFNDRWFGFDDGIYASVRLCELLSQSASSPAEVFQTLPKSFSTPEMRIHCDSPPALVDEFKRRAKFDEADIIAIDGLRADFADGFALIRASNTASEIVLRFDADSSSALDRIQKLVYGLLESLVSLEDAKASAPLVRDFDEVN